MALVELGSLPPHTAQVVHRSGGLGRARPAGQSFGSSFPGSLCGTWLVLVD